MAAKRSGSPLHKVGLGVRLLGASVLAGALVAGLGVPAVGALGLGAKSAADDFNNIPDSFTAPPLTQSSTIYDANGGVIATVYSRDRTVVPLSQIAPIMRSALIDIEDNRYYQHGAIDLEGTLRALTKNASSGGVAQGGSTLTQQYVKNVFVEEAGNDTAKVLEAQRQTTGRKIQELRYAIKLEETLSKDQILADYLNITFFGEQSYGVEAASERYFSVHASQLTIPQAALLAGMVQSPTGYDPLVNPQLALQRRNEVLADMAKYGTIKPAQATAAEATPLNLKVSFPKEGCITATKGEGFFCDYVEQQVLDDPTFGATSAIRQQLWDQGGLKIYTTLNPTDQADTQNAINNHTNPNDSVVAASAMVQPGTGKILAMAQSRPYGTGSNQTEINYNAPATEDGGEGFQTGSVFKAITAATALSNGYQLSHVINSVVAGNYPAMTDCNGNYFPEGTGDQMINDGPTNYGNIDMVTAMANSVNTYFVPLEQQVGLCKVVQMAQAFGLGYQDAPDSKSPNGLTPISQVPTLTLGVNTYTPVQMANVYAAFAANGMYCNTTAITRVVNTSGKDLPVPASDCHQVVTPEVAAGVNTTLKSVVSDEGTGASDSLSGYSDAGKTGTTNDDDQAWFDGYTSQIADATVMTNPNYPNKSMDEVDIDGNYYPHAYGYLTSGPIWHDAMQAAMNGMQNVPLSFQDTPSAPPSNTTPTPGTSPGTNNTTGNNNGGPGKNGGGH